MVLFCRIGLSLFVLQGVLTNAFYNETKLQFYFSEIALSIPEEGRKNFRSNDPSLIVPHLYESDMVSVDFEIFTPMNMSIDNVTYSNDGGSDRVKVMLDGFEIGSFDTHSQSNWGEMWDYFYGSYEIGDWETVFPGLHTISFKVDHSKDCFGVELGTMYVTVDESVDVQTFWRNPGYKLTKTKQKCKTGQHVEPKEVTETSQVTALPLPPSSSTVGSMKLSTGPLIPDRLYTTLPITQSGATTSILTASESELSRTTTSYPTLSMSVTSSRLWAFTLSESTVSSPFQSSRTLPSTPDVAKFTTPSHVLSSSSSTTLLAPTSLVISSTPAARTTSERMGFTSLKSGEVHLEQLSRETDCMDNTNVRIKITQSGLEGTRIIARTTGLRKNKNAEADTKYLQDKTTCGLDSWQLGKIDGDNTEFQHFVPHDIVTVKLKNNKQDTDKFPGKILPFITPIIRITFDVKNDIQLHNASSFFVVGLVNLTKETFIGLQYNSRPMDTHFLTFTPQRHIMGWSISDLSHGTNHFFLHFDTGVNTIMFDFLKFQIRANEIRKINIRIMESKTFRVKGILSPEKRGILMTTDGVAPLINLENIVIFHRSDHTFKYNAVLSIKSNGAICLYHPNGNKPSQPYSKRQLSDVSQFTFRREDDSINNGGDISSLNFNTKSFVLTIIYKDGSILITQLNPSEESTELLVKSFYTFDKKMNQIQTQTVTFLSTYVNEYLAAVNEISDGTRTLNIMDNLDTLNVSDKISLKKTSPTKVFLANEILEINFPK